MALEPCLPSLSVATLRALFKNLQSFHAVYEASGIDTIIGPDGVEWCIHDLDYLYRQLHVLPPRQHQAIELCLIRNVKESDAAVMMGISPNTPVCAYSNTALASLIRMIEAGRFPRFQYGASEREMESA